MDALVDYLEALKNYGCPTQPVTDRGTENRFMAGIHFF